jgi:dolichol-phosphate mannosyltransferase
MATKTLTVICPVYNEEITIPLFYKRLRAVFDSLRGRYFTQLIFTDNASSDRSQQIISDLCDGDPEVSIITLSRNFGYQSSVECGLRHAAGDLIVVIDVDCEDPPEMIATFLEHHQTGGYDIVYGERTDRPEWFLMKQGRKLFYRFTRSVADDAFILDMAEFCLMTAEVRDAIMKDNNSFPFIRSSIGRIGFKSKGIAYARHPRVAGKTHYNFRRIAIFAIAGILSSTTFPLRLPAYVLPFWLLLMLVIGVTGVVVGGSRCITLLLLVAFTYFGFILAFISIYVARIYKNGLSRPNFVIDSKLTRLRPPVQTTDRSPLEYSAS